MISYDWQQRLKKDCKDFLNNKIPNRDYDFEIIYNAYPERANGEIPQYVTTFVAKKLAKNIARKPDQFIDFLQFIQKNKGDVGKKIFNIIMQKVALKNPGKYDRMLIDLVKETEDENSLRKIFDNIIFPLLKKYPEKYIDELIEWLRVNNNKYIIENIFRSLSNYIKVNKEEAKDIFENCESFWNSENQSIRAGNIKILKRIFKVNPELYREIYNNYQSTYNPNFIEILASAVSEDSKIIRQVIERWNKSGNVRIKKAAVIANKNIAKIKKK